MKRILFPLLAALALSTATLAIAQSSDPSQSATPSPTAPSATATTPAPTTTPSSSMTSEPATAQNNTATMPKTASPLPTLGVSALLALAAGYSLMRPRRRA